jgi:tricorn protease
MLTIALPLLMSAAVTPPPWFGTDAGFPQYPSISPHGKFVVYSDRGDLWAVPRSGGSSSRLTSHPASEMRSAFSPDGRTLAFESDRDGTANIYTMPLAVERGRMVAAGPIERLTVSDRWQALSGFTPDGQAVLFHSYADPTMYRQPLVYQAPLDGGPVSRPTTAHGRSPRVLNDTLYMSRGYAPWERPAYRGSGNRDLWSMDLQSGDFTRRSNTRSNEGQAFPRPDGSIALLSSADGQNDIWVIPEGATFDAAVNRTRLGVGDEPTIGHGARDLSVSADGSTAVIGLWDTLATLDLKNPRATLQTINLQRGGDMSTLDRRIERLDHKVAEVALHPSGEAVAMVARGEVLVRSTTDDHPTRRVTADHARQKQIAWSPDGTRLWFTSDAGGDEGIWEATVVLERKDLKPEDDSEEEAAEEDAPEATDDETDEDAEANEEEDSDTDEAKEKPTKKSVKNKSGERWADSLRFDVHQLVPGPAASRPMPSPDGAKLLYQRGIGDLVLRDLETGDETVLLESWDAPEVRWASDSQHIVYSVSDLEFNNDIWLMDTQDPQAATNLTRHPDIDRAPRLSDDGKVLVFLSDRNRMGDNGDYDVWAMPLDPSLEDMTEYELNEYFKEAAKAAGKKKIIALPASDDEPKAGDDTDEDDADDPPDMLEFTDLDTAWQRARRLTRHEGSEDDLYLTPGGDTIIYSGTVDGDKGLWKIDHHGKERKKLTSGDVSNVRANLTGKKVTFVSGGTAKHAPAGGGKAEAWPIDADAEIDVASEQRQKFEETARTFGSTFYHPTMKGLDWEAISASYADLASQTRTSQAFNRVVDQLFGEVNGSHTGISGGFDHNGPRSGMGYLGVETRPVERGYEVTAVLPDGPADKKEGGLETGDVIVAVDGVALAREGTSVRELRGVMGLTYGREILVDILRNGEDRVVLLEPISYGTRRSLARAAELAARRDEVAALSNDRLGYLHIRGMSMPSVHEFEQDLYAAAHDKDGLIIDVRDNGGGFTTDILLASLTAPAHAFTVPRGADVADVRPDSYPRDRRLLHGYSRPIVVLCNENSFSNAEIFSHAIKTIGRGPLVGEETFGGVISTGSFKLIDGSRVRQPFRGWYLPDGTDMESRGAIPDVRVEQLPGDEVAGRDAQLEAAVSTLLKQLPDTPPSVHPRPAM